MLKRNRYSAGDWFAVLSKSCVEHKGNHIEWIGEEINKCIKVPLLLRHLLPRDRTSNSVSIAQAFWIIEYGRFPEYRLIWKCKKPWCINPRHRIENDPEIAAIRYRVWRRKKERLERKNIKKFLSLARKTGVCGLMLVKSMHQGA